MTTTPTPQRTQRARLRDLAARARKASSDLGRIREEIEDPYTSRFLWILALIIALLAGLLAGIIAGVIAR